MKGERFRQSRSGTSAVEFAILSPVFLVMIFGLIAYGVYISASNSVQQIAADAARLALAGLTDTERSDLANRYIRDYSSRYAFVDPARLAVSYEKVNTPDQVFVVTVSLDANTLPIWQLTRDLPLPSTTIRKSSVMRIGTP